MENNKFDQSVKDLLHYHKLGTENIKKALSIDENSVQKDEAIKFYKLGIEEFLLGLKIKLKGDERGKHIQEKMESNLTMALERVQELSGPSCSKRFLSKTQSAYTSSIHCLLTILLRTLLLITPIVTMLLNDQSPRLESLKKKIERTRIERMKSINSNEASTSSTNCLPRTSNSTRDTNNNDAAKLTTKVSNLKINNSKLTPARPSSSISKPASSRPISATKKTSQTTASATTNTKVPIGKKLKIPNVDDKLIEFILDEIVDSGQSVKFSDISGQEKAKQALNELVILPALNPSLFTGLRSPVKGLLLFGPPGNGKTMLAKAVANEANCKFFNITAASLTSKYVGEGEKLVRALFALALYIQPAIIFIDEIDSLLFERKENDHEASRRLKTEFLSQFDGMQSNSQDRILVMGATNRPYELDNAALRRFPKRIYIGLPDKRTRITMLQNLLSNQSHSIRSYDLDELARLTEGYSGSDLTALAKDASLGPIREQSVETLKSISANKIRPLNFHDFENSVNKIRQSTPKDGLIELEKWNREYGDINT